MRQIIKGPEPATLTRHRKAAHAVYDNYLDKDTLREHLVGEQRGICCYCMRRIRPSAQTMKMEHWRSQERYPAEQLNYGNLLGACLVNQGQRRMRQHCDTRKGEQDLSRNPSDPAHHVEDLIRFQPDGTVASDNPAFNAELNNVLNLNEGRLCNNRKAVLDAFCTTLAKWGNLQRHTLENLLADWTGSSRPGELREYSQIIVYWLRKRLARI